MRCIHCDSEISDDAKFCTNCGQSVNKEEIKVTSNEKQWINGINNDTFLCLASIFCAFACPTIGYGLSMLSILLNNSYIIQSFSKLFYLLSQGALPLAIVAKVKYPESKFAKVLLIFYLVSAILAIIAFVILIVSCINLLQDCGNSNLGFILWR